MSEKPINIKSEQGLLFLDWYNHEKKNKPVDRNELASFIREKRKVLTKIISEEKKETSEPGSVDWFLSISQKREELGLPKFIELSTFVAFIQIITMKQSDTNYDILLKLLRGKNFEEIKSNSISGPRTEKLINNQGAFLKQGIVEIVANAIDATIPDENIGRFGEGFYQSLKYLEEDGSNIEVSSKKQGEKSFSVHLVKKNDEVHVGSLENKKEENGTKVILRKKISEKEQKEIRDFLISRFKTNTNVSIILNGTEINPFSNYTYYNGKKLNSRDKFININIDSEKIEVIDNGVGMDSKDLSEKLLYPTSSSKRKVNLKGEELEASCEEKTKMFYTRTEKTHEKQYGKTKKQKTDFRMQVAGVLIEDFSVETNGNIDEFTVEFPNFTWLPESRNKIEPTIEVVLSIISLLKKVENNVEDLEEKIDIINMLGEVIKKLKTRKTNITEKKYDLGYRVKDTFKGIKKQMEESGIIPFCGDEKLINCLGKREGIAYVSPDFLDIDISSIPGVKKLENIENPQLPFYEIDFDKNAEYSYLIASDFILVDSKYTKDEESISILNTAINLNIGYEIEKNKVFYGRIDLNADGFSIDENGNNTKNNSRGGIIKTINSTEEIELFRERVNNIYEDNIYIKRSLDKEYSEIIYEKYLNLINKLDFYSKNNISHISDNMLFFILFSFYDIPDILDGKDKKEEFLEKYKESLLEYTKEALDLVFLFQSFLYACDEKDKYISMILLIIKEDISYAKKILNRIGQRKFNKYIFKQFLDKYSNEIDINYENSDLREIFKNNKPLFFKILGKGEKINYCYDICEINGKIAGRVKIGDRSYPFKGDQIIKEIGGKKFYDCVNVFRVNGEIAGRVRIGDKYYPFIGDRIIEKIGGREFDYCEKIFVINGEIAGITKIGNKYYPFKGDRIIEKIGGREFDYCDEICEIDGEIAGITKIGNKYYPFKGDEIIEKIGGEEIDGCDDICEINKEIAGRVRIGNKRYPFKGNKIIKEIGGEDFDDCYNVCEINGEIAGRVKIGDKYYPFIGDKIIRKIGGEDFDDCNNICEIGGEIAGKVKIGGKWYPFKGDKIIRIIGGKEFDDYCGICEVNGEIAGMAKIGDNLYPFIGDKIIEKIGGEYFDYYFSIHEVNGEKTGIVKKGDEWYQFIGDYILGSDINFEEVSSDITNFMDFVIKGGEFLKEKASPLTDINLTKRFNLSEFIALSRTQQDFLGEQEGEQKTNGINLEEMIYKLDSIKEYNLDSFKREIYSSIEGQDRSSMVWLREMIQNSRDAIKKSKGNNQENNKIDIDFFKNSQGNWCTSFSDKIGMTPFEVYKYLLVPGESSKNSGDGVGMFGQGFYSLAIGAKQISLKTGIGNGNTTYLKLIPLKNDNDDIVDFIIETEIKKENFKGTTILRIDEGEGISSNLKALKGVNNTLTYAGNIDDNISINYNGTILNKTGNKKIEEEIEVDGLGTLQIISNKDRIERLTQNNLFISEIPDDHLSFLPDFMIDIIRRNCLSIDIPAGIGLTKSRNSMTDYERNLKVLKPYIFLSFSRYILKEYSKGNIKIPMLPEDYYGLDMYNYRHDKNIDSMATKVNNGKILNNSDIKTLKDESKMVQFLVLLEFIGKDGKKISLKEIKDNIESEKHTSQLSGEASLYATEYRDRSESLNKSMESANRPILSLEESVNELGIEKREISDFLNFLDEKFNPLVQEIFGVNIKNNIYKREGGESRVAYYGFDENGIYMNWNCQFIKKWILGYKKPEIYEKIIETMTHELSHLKEGSHKWGTHEKDLEHDDSFEKIQRGILEVFLRMNKK